MAWKVSKEMPTGRPTWSSGGDASIPMLSSALMAELTKNP